MSETPAAPESVDTPESADTPPMRDISTMIAERSAETPEATALVFEGEAMSWRELDRCVNRIANALIAAGLGKSDKVAILAESYPRYVTTFLGALRAGGCAVPLSGMASSKQLEMMIEDSEARVLVVSDSMRPLIDPFADHLSGLLPGGRIAVDFEAKGWTGFEQWIDAASDRAPDIGVDPGDGFNLIYSSGTTGVPKGILQSHGMRMFHVERFGALGLGRDAVTLVSTALYSNTTLVTMLPTLALGGTTVLMRKFDAGEFLRLAEQERVTHAMLVPVQYRRILDHPDFDRRDLGAFRVKLSTSAPLRAAIKREILDRWPGGLVEVYGLTEGGGSTVLDCASYPDKLESVGRPGPGSDVRVIGENGEELPSGEIGEIVGRSSGMMDGYYRRRDLTDVLLWCDGDGNRFYRTGDMGRFDEDGFLYLLDRIKDMIISGGFNIYASDLEDVLLRHEAVADAAVIGVPSERWGETPLGLVVVKADARLTPEALKEWANARLGKTQRLSAVEFRESLPRSTIGKVLKRELRKPYWEDTDA